MESPLCFKGIQKSNRKVQVIFHLNKNNKGIMIQLATEQTQTNLAFLSHLEKIFVADFQGSYCVPPKDRKTGQK